MKRIIVVLAVIVLALLIAGIIPQNLATIPAFLGKISVLLGVAAGTLISEDLACAGAGLLVAQGSLDGWEAVLACFLGIFLGDVLLYVAGMAFGRRGFPRWLLTESEGRAAAKWIAEKGLVVVIVSRFLPGSRLPVYLAAGMLHSGWQFLLYFLLASALWTPLLVLGSAAIGKIAFQYVGVSSQYGPWLGAAALSAFCVGMAARRRSSRRKSMCETQ